MISSQEKKIVCVPFAEIKSSHLEAIKTIAKDAVFESDIDSFSKKGYIFNRVDYSQLQNLPFAGRVFLLCSPDGREPVAFVICFDNIDSPIKSISSILPDEYNHERQFVRELEGFGIYGYVDQIVVRQQYRALFSYGYRLLKEVDDYYNKQKATLLGGIIHGSNYYSLRFCLRMGWDVVDFYSYPFDSHPSGHKSNELWFRMCKILRPDALRNHEPDDSTVTLLLKLRFLGVVSRLNEALSRVGNGHTVLAKHEPRDHCVVTWAGWVYADKRDLSKGRIPLSGFCAYETIRDAISQMRRDRTRFKKINEATQEALKWAVSYYEERQHQQAVSVIPKMRDNPHWLFLTDAPNVNNLQDDLISKVQKHLPYSESPLLISISSREDDSSSNKMKEFYGGGESQAWKHWIEVYRRFYDADRIVYSHSGKDHNRWLHIIGPLFRHNDRMVGVFLTVVYPNNIPHERVGDELGLAMRALSGELNDVIAVYSRKRSFEYASRAASAAILSRNMSHHIGSHVMSRATVRDVNDRLETLYSGGRNNSNWKLEAVERLKTKLDDYIQKKADFLAEVTTDPCSSSESRRLGRDIIAPFIRNALLMDTIARNERFGYVEKDHCTLKVSLCFSKEGKACQRLLDISPPPYDPVFGMRASEANKVPEYGVPSELADIDPFIAVPGVQGHYALYGILENLIRNAAKYGKDIDGKDERGHSFLHIHLHVEQEGNDYYRLRIWDNRTDPRVKKKEAIPDRSGKPVEAERPLAEHLQAWMEAPLIGPSGEVRREAWGIAEIVVCANLLAGKTDIAYDANIITVREATTPHAGKSPALTCKGKDESWEPCQANRVVYSLRLLKGKRALFIGDCFAKEWSGKTLETLTNAGIQVVRSAREFIQSSSGPSRIAYPFVVIDEASSGLGELSDAETKSLHVRCPFRVFRIRNGVPEDGMRDPTTWDWVLSANPFQNMSQNMTADDLVERLWKLWLNSLKISQRQNYEKPVSINVYLDVQADERLFQQWKAATQWFNTKPLTVKMLVQSSDRVSEGPAYKPGEALRVGFDRHGRLDMSSLAPDDFYEVFHKRSPDWDLVWSTNRPKCENDFWELPYRLAEAGLLRILVIDERIAERALRLYEGDPEFKNKLFPSSDIKPCVWHEAWRAKIFIATHLKVAGQKAVPVHAAYDSALEEHRNDPTRTCPRLEISICQNEMKATALDLFGEKAQSPEVMLPDFDVVLIHQGVLDTHAPPSNSDGALLSWIMNARPWTIVESGRGIPPELQNKNIRFLAYSILDQALLTNRIGKVLLTRRVMALPRFVSE